MWVWENNPGKKQCLSFARVLWVWENPPILLYLMCHLVFVFCVLWTDVSFFLMNLSGYLHPIEHVQLHVVCTGAKHATEGWYSYQSDTCDVESGIYIIYPKDNLPCSYQLYTKPIQKHTIRWDHRKWYQCLVYTNQLHVVWTFFDFAM